MGRGADLPCRVVRVVLVGGDTPTRIGLRAALEDDGFEIAAEVRDGAAAVAAGGLRPDLALVCSSLDGDLAATVQTIASGLPGARIVVLAERPDDAEFLAVSAAGAFGYLGLEIGPERLPHALATALGGEALIPRRFGAKLLDELQRRRRVRHAVLENAGAPLTERELQVLELLGEGHSTREIAERLTCSQVTVRRHVSSIKSKLGVDDRAEAVDVLHGRFASRA
jgi:DNA-binding NarL/FixJ family response regulator